MPRDAGQQWKGFFFFCLDQFRNLINREKLFEDYPHSLKCLQVKFMYSVIEKENIASATV